MSEKQFDMFDERFRNAAEQYEPPFEEAAWVKLESKLDAEKKRRRPFAWLWWTTDAVILALVGYLAFTIAPLHNDKTQSDNPAGIVKSSPALTEKREATNRDNTKETEIKSTTASALQSTTAAGIHSKMQSDNEGYSQKAKPDISVSVNRKQNNTDQTTPAPAVATDDNILHAGNRQVATDKKTIAKNSAPGQPTTTEQETINKRVAPKDGSGAASIAIVEVEQKTQTPLVEKDPVTEAKNDPKPKAKVQAGTAKKGFYIYGSFGPEWSFVKGNKSGEITYPWGFGVGYRLSAKWAVQAGYFSTKKLYEAGPGDYQPKPGTYYYNLTINHVKADCRVTEIPIVVSYTFHEGKKQAFNAGVGLSSFIMNEEKYHYNYERMNGTPAYAYYSYKTHNSHLLAGLLLTAGYSVQLVKNLSLKAEPYIKIPLYGVGEGSIKIYSYGMMAGLQYNLPSLRKK